MFTENQVRQFYVATSTSADVIAPVQVDDSHKATDLSAKSAGACQFVINPDGNAAYLMYKGPSDDGLQRSDLIKKCNVMDVRLTDAADMKHIKKRLEVALASNLVNNGNLVATDDYVLNVEIKNYIALGDDSTKIKFGVAHGAAGSAASDLYKKLAINMAKNLSREAVPVLKVMLKTASDPVEVKAKDTVASLTATATGIIFEEVEQPWRRGAAKQEFVNFELLPSTVYANNEDVIWGVVTDVTASNTANFIPNSKAVADMEYFFHKERGDVYGYVGFPNNLDTVYQVDPNNANGYSFVDIHFFFEGNSMNVGKSEKTLTIVGAKADLKKLIGTSGASATGLYAFLEGTGVAIKESKSWA